MSSVNMVMAMIVQAVISVRFILVFLVLGWGNYS